MLNMLLIGSTSILGYHMVRLGDKRVVPVCHINSDAWARRSVRVDLDNPGALGAVVKTYGPQPLVYAHAVCNVNKCEQNADWAWEVNVENLKRFLENLPKDRRLVYLSSDHVFGQGGLCDELTIPQPISVYGQTRIAAEKLVLARPNSMVIRASLALGDSHDGRSGHWNWLNHRLGKELPVTIITDEARTTIWAPEAAWRIMKLANSRVNGMVHLSNDFYISREQLAIELCEIGKLKKQLKYDQRANQTYPHLGQVQLVSRRHEGRLLINPLKQLALHVQSECSIV